MRVDGAGTRGDAVTVAAVLLLTLAVAARPALAADAYEERRVRAGLRLFRALLAADSDLEKKTVGGRLLVLFYYTDDRTRAEALAAALGDEPIRGLPVAVEATSDAAFGAYAERPPAGVFIAQAPDGERLRAVIRFGIARRVIVYSPFEGHVERGVLGGLAVEAQVRPYVNLETLAASNISLKQFFLKVTKVYR